ncbi:MAG: ribosome-associated translation inhibitor RaiA [Clostridiales bacterium]|nr:ribosome-associated translation inhibitor RaiA [Clostridiales bacterium]
MKTTITGRKVTLKDSFKERVDKKLNKVSRFFSPAAEAAVTVHVEKGRQTVEVTIRDAGMIFRAEETAPDMLDALEKVMDVIVRQIRKNKTRLEKRMKESDFSILPIDEEPEELPYDVVKSKRFSLNPMSVDEAILQMNLLEHIFFVFLNMDTGLVNVIYRRNDGNYGLIEAAAD